MVEDDLDIQAAVQKRFEDEGFGVDVAANREDAEFAADINEYDVLVLDRTVPGGDMLGFLERRRATGDATPALFLTARDSVQDRVDGFTGGGDDYLVKPFAMDELVVRVRALARRREVTQAPILELGDLVIDRARAEVRRDGVLLPLTAKEREILLRLADEVGVVVSRSDLVESCWDDLHDPMSNVVDVHVGRLRRKLGDPSPLRTVRGAGFVLEAP